PQAFIRIDCSEYSEQHAHARLIGSPPGYVGYNEGGVLVNRVGANPHCVVVFDEVEKAHPNTHQIFLQMLEEGTVQSGAGIDISFKNAIVIMTSNSGAREARDLSKRCGFSRVQTSGDLRTAFRGAIEESFNPEILGRIDEILIFNALTETDLKRICRLQLDELTERVKDLYGIQLQFSSGVKHFLVKHCANQQYGARPLRGIIKYYITRKLARQLLARPHKVKVIKVGIKKGEITFSIL
ncbi:ATP-dependent Clp protease ATP-binding subunit, partial [Candidatus Parcubacteria bacterium]